MTTEIAVLNKLGVALAADSAVTVTSGSAVRKIYVDANKMFELVKGKPVGIMVYGGGEVGGHPWETVAKAYRPEAGPQDSLALYATHFLGFVADYLVLHTSFEQQKRTLHVLAGNLAGSLLESAQEEAGGMSGRLARRKYLVEMIAATQDDASTRTVQEWARGIDEAAVWKANEGVLMAAMPDSFEASTLPAGARRQLARLVLTLLLRIDRIQGPSSGLVVAGFGEKEPFPAIFDCQVYGLVLGSLMVVGKVHQAISNEKPGLISTFAQVDDAHAFISGIDPEVQKQITSFWSSWALEVVKSSTAIAKASFGRSQEPLTHYEKSMAELMTKSWSAFADFMNERQMDRRVRAIQESVAFLSKREIAEFAENLVDITSLRRRVSLDHAETVGGATDVAVISKGDGFVWLKRKHYFSAEFNPIWASRQLVDAVVSRLQAEWPSGGSSYARTVAAGREE